MMIALLTSLFEPQYASYWIAIAAACSAFCAVLMVFITIKNRADANRPELIVTKWVRSEVPSDEDVERFGAIRIKNVGTGLALRCIIRSVTQVEVGESTYPIFYATAFHPAIGVGEEVEIDGTGCIFWKNVEKQHDFASAAFIKFDLDASDVLERRHFYKYSLVVEKDYATQGNRM